MMRIPGKAGAGPMTVFGTPQKFSAAFHRIFHRSWPKRAFSCTTGKATLFPKLPTNLRYDKLAVVRIPIPWDHAMEGEARCRPVECRRIWAPAERPGTPPENLTGNRNGSMLPRPAPSGRAEHFRALTIDCSHLTCAYGRLNMRGCDIGPYAKGRPAVAGPCNRKPRGISGMAPAARYAAWAPQAPPIALGAQVCPTWSCTRRSLPW